MWQVMFLALVVSVAAVRFNVSSNCSARCNFFDPQIWDNQTVPVNNSDVNVISDAEVNLYIEPGNFDITFNSLTISGPVLISQAINVTYGYVSVTNGAVIKVINYNLLTVNNSFFCASGSSVSLSGSTRMTITSNANFTIVPACTLNAEGNSLVRIDSPLAQIDGKLQFEAGTFLYCTSDITYLSGQTNVSGLAFFEGRLIANADAVFYGGLVLQGFEVNVGKIVLVFKIFSIKANDFFLNQGSTLILKDCAAYITIPFGGVNTGLGAINIYSSNFTMMGPPGRRYGLNAKITFFGQNEMVMHDVVMNNPQFVDSETQARYITLRPLNLLINSEITIPGQIVVDAASNQVGVTVGAPLHTSSIVVNSGIVEIISNVKADDHIVIAKQGLVRVNCSEVIEISVPNIFINNGTYLVLAPHLIKGNMTNNGYLDLHDDLYVDQNYIQLPNSTLRLLLSTNENESTVIYATSAALQGRVEYDTVDIKTDASFLILQSTNNITGQFNGNAHKSSLSKTRINTMEIQYRDEKQVLLVFQYDVVEAWFVWGFSIVCALAVIISIIVYFIRDKPHSAYLS